MWLPISRRLRAVALIPSEDLFLGLRHNPSFLTSTVAQSLTSKHSELPAPRTNEQ